jgi:hypothetical protein
MGIAALSPHAGETGMFGRREIDEIVPSVEAARAAGVDAQGPFPADAIFLKGHDGHFDGISARWRLGTTGWGHKGVPVSLGGWVVRHRRARAPAEACSPIVC